ncbi:MAG TPA: hypothetical protein ENJ77_01445, partial [Candidatus Moranbacteria bacterium]|nr:hypothetical protein [Candidatus Moranbacteria bacterium]
MHTEETAFVRQPATDLDPVVSESKERKVSFERFLDAVITFSLSATVFGVPLFFTSLSLQGISFDKSIYFYLWVLLAAVAWAIKGALRGELIIRRTPLDWPLLALLAAATISMIFAADRWHSFWGSFGDPSHGLMMLLALAVFYIIAGSHLNEKRLTKVFVALLCAGALVTIWTFLGLLSMPFLPAAWAAYSPLSLIGSVKGLALFLAMMVPLFISGTFSAARSLEEDELPVWKRALLRPALALLLVLSLLAIVDLYMLFSYTPWLALVAGLVFFLIYILAHIVKPAQVLVWLPMLAVVMVAAFMMIGRPVCAPFSPLALCRLPAEIAPNPSLSWEIAREGVKENLFFGAGPAMYGEVFAKNHPPTDGNALFTVLFYQGEGALFEALATIGPVGTFLAM